jgi:hypothetical protein
MHTETVLRRVALGCAVFMLFGPLGGRTTWVKVHGNGSSITDAGIYNAVAVISGVVALAALAVALHLRPRLVLPVFGILVAIAAFALTIYVSGMFVWARLQGELWFYGAASFAGDMGGKWTVRPAWGPPFFALAALIGALASLALAVTWLWHRQGDASRHVRSA